MRSSALLDEKGTAAPLKKTQPYRREQGIILPRRTRQDPQVGPDVLMVMIPSELDYLVRATAAQELPLHEMARYRLYRATNAVDAPLALAGPFLGAPQAVMAMEKLIILGARRIWVLGWCGSLQPELRTGHLVIPTGAVSEEGTSAHYPIQNRPITPDGRLTGMLEAELERQGLPFSSGRVWTTDAVYRETRPKVKAYQAQGILAVEMETSALMTLAIYRSVAMAGLLTVSDELFDLKWRPGFRDPLLKEHSRAAGRVLVALAGASGRGYHRPAAVSASRVMRPR
jgi:uridine phosphorylase